jgi:hypothetical protein
MIPTTTSRTRRIARRINAVWTELDYAQRRLLEIRTGATGLVRRRDPKRSEL